MSHPDGALKELHREHEVAERLLERLAEIGERIKSGERVDPKAVRFGVGLLDAYLHRVHAFQEDRELLPEARYVAMPQCFAYLDGMAPLHEEMRRRARELLDMISRWASGDESSRSAIGDGLVDLASLDHDVAGEEATHPLMCLEGALPEAANQRLSSRFSDHAGTRAALEANIERFLSDTRAGGGLASSCGSARREGRFRAGRHPPDPAPETVGHPPGDEEASVEDPRSVALREDVVLGAIQV